MNDVMKKLRVISGVLAAVLVGAGVAVAQPATEPKPVPPIGEGAGKKDDGAGEALPDLDALLKLPPSKPRESGQAGGGVEGAEAEPGVGDEAGVAKPENASGLEREPESELEGLLSAAETKDEFEQAIALMGQTAARLERAGDAGLTTQRLQEDVLKRLDKLITSAEKQQQKQSSSSKPKPQQQQQQQQQQQKNMAKQSTPQRSQDSSTTAEPPQREGDGGGLTPPTASAAAAWGELPEHVRDALLQGSSDRYSSMYRAMTERYYKKLAEEPRK